MTNLRTLSALREYAAAVSADHGLDASTRDNILRLCRQQAAYIAERVIFSDTARAQALVVEIESR